VPQSSVGKPEAVEDRTEQTRSFVRRVRSATRRKYTSEEKIRIVLKGFRSEVTVSDLCKREGIKPHSSYAWIKEFMEDGKERLARDSVRDATRKEIHALKRENGELKNKSPQMQLKAGKEYHRKTTAPHQMWATDASYFKVIGWGYYYMVTVMDDYSRFILAHKLQRDMTSDSFIEVVQEAVDETGMTEVPVADRTTLLSDNGSGYVSRAFNDYLHLVGIRHILAAPYHPQTNGKLERYHQTIKRDINQVPYELTSDLEAAIAAFVTYYNYSRYHMALNNVTPADVLNGRREQILQRRKEVQLQTIDKRRRYNRTVKELSHGSP